MSKPIPCPCHNCPDRWINPDTLETCRPSCKRGYAEWVAQEQERKAKLRAETIADQRVYEHFKKFRRKREKRGYVKL